MLSSDTIESLYWYSIFILHSPKLLLLMLTHFSMPTNLESYLIQRNITKFPVNRSNYWEYVLKLLNNATKISPKLKLSAYLKDVQVLVEIVLQVINYYHQQPCMNNNTTTLDHNTLHSECTLPYYSYNIIAFSYNYKINPYYRCLISSESCFSFSMKEFLLGIFESGSVLVIDILQELKSWRLNDSNKGYDDNTYIASDIEQLCCSIKGRNSYAICRILNSNSLEKQKSCPHIPNSRPKLYEIHFNIVYEQCLYNWRK